MFISPYFGGCKYTNNFLFINKNTVFQCVGLLITHSPPVRSLLEFHGQAAVFDAFIHRNRPYRGQTIVFEVFVHQIRGFYGNFCIFGSWEIPGQGRKGGRVYTKLR